MSLQGQSLKLELDNIHARHTLSTCVAFGVNGEIEAGHSISGYGPKAMGADLGTDQTLKPNVFNL